MTARLRVLFVAPEIHLLVLDRMGLLAAEQAEAIVRGCQSPAAQGVLVFPFEVDIPDESDEGTVIHVDERLALRWAVDALDVYPVGGSPGELHPRSRPAENLAALRLLLARIEDAP